MPGLTRRVAESAVTTVIALWGLYQCFWNIGAADFNADEPTYLEAGWEYVHGTFTANLEHPPTAKYLIGAAQLLLGQGHVAGRIAASTMVCLGAIVLYFWFRREVGWFGGVLAAGLWLVLPRGVSSGVRIDRFALLEPFMAFFAIASFAAAWAWYRRPAPVWLVTSAVAMALSVTSKVSSLVLLPAILVLLVARRREARVLVSGLIYLVTFVAVFLLVYLPVGVVSALSYMLSMESNHDTGGHPVVVGDVAYTHPPWWAELLFTVNGLGISATVVIVAGSLAAIWAVRALLVRFLGVGVAALLFFYLVVSQIALPHYYYAWVWPLTALAGAGIAGLLGRPLSGRRLIAARAAAVLLLVVAARSGIQTSLTIAEERPTGMARVTDVLAQRGVPTGKILVEGMADWEYRYYLGGHEITNPAEGGIVAFAIKHSARFPLSPGLAEQLNDPAAYQRIELDDVELYIPRR